MPLGATCIPSGMTYSAEAIPCQRQSAARLAWRALPVAAGDLNVQHWRDDSFNAAKSGVYEQPPIDTGTGPFTLTPAYKAKAKTIAQKQVALGGARLAKILNDELK